MAARLTAGFSHGVLTVKGTNAADVIAVDLQGNSLAVEGIRKTFRASQVKRIVVLGGSGDDTITVQTAGRPQIAVRIDGGAGNDTVNGVSEIPISVPVVPTPVAPTPLPITSVPAPTASAAVQRIIDLTNAERVKVGLAPLAVNGALMRAAGIQSSNMARLNLMSHTLPGTSTPTLTDRAAAVGYQFSTLGENIAFNYADADAVVVGWMASAGHRENILSPSFTEIGVAIATNSQGQPYYTQVFGRPG